jgi:hypothetical protein
MKKLALVFLALVLFAPIRIAAQTSAANKAWTPFFARFKVAVNSKSKVRVKAFMAPYRKFQFGGGYFKSNDDWLRYIDKQHAWGELIGAVNGGVKYFDWEGKPGRITLPEEQGSLIFAFLNGKWVFIALMGD